MIFVNKNKPIRYINKIPFLIHAIVRIEHVNDPNDVKAYLGVDTAFKNDKEGVYYFCQEIPEAIWEEVVEEEVKVEKKTKSKAIPIRKKKSTKSKRKKSKK